MNLRRELHANYVTLYYSELTQKVGYVHSHRNKSFESLCANSQVGKIKKSVLWHLNAPPKFSNSIIYKPKTKEINTVEEGLKSEEETI